jgi:GMP synthase-like glutamine amidotransferase
MRRQGLPFDLRNTEVDEAYPEHMDAHSALAILGGEMSANDPLPSLRRAELLILDAMARGRPVIGHCLGGQLMARALGARVVASPAPEIGWHDIQLETHESARQWFGDQVRATVFQWHEEAFELPPGATPLAGSDACTYQAFAIGPHLAMQFHLEVDEEKLRRWSMLDSEAYRSLQQRHATVQGGAVMREAMAVHLPVQQELADRVYARWLDAAISRVG